MKKILTIFAVTALVSFSVNAQNNYSSSNVPTGNTLSVGAELGLPTGDLSNGYKTGFGVSAKYAHPLGEHGAITGSLAYISFSGKDGIPAWNTTPVKIGYRYNVSNGNFYLEPQLGYTFGSVSGVSSSDASGFTWALGAGYFVAPNVDLGLRYESTSVTGGNANFFGLHVAYSFNLGTK